MSDVVIISCFVICFSYNLRTVVYVVFVIVNDYQQSVCR